MRAMDCRNSLRRNAEEALRSTTSFRRRVPGAGLQVTFCFQTIKSGVHGTDRNLSLGAGFHLAPDGNAIGFIAQTQNREKHHVLEFAEVAAIRH